MRDVKELRCGQEWQPEILELIKEADVFHLFWSYASEKSPYVEKEWKEALKQARKNFIRPVYWEVPPPERPPELKGIQFTELDF
jgi:predicted thioredoxin/glutaredoxin